MYFIWVLLAAFFNISHAQNASTPTSNWSISFVTGPMLPNKVDGLTEIQPAWGVRGTLPGHTVDYYEFGFLLSNSNDVDWKNVFFSLKQEVILETFLTQIYAGLDYVIYDAPNVDKKLFSGHLGSAFLGRISKYMWLRSDLKIHLRPGTILFIGFGVEARF